MYIFAEIYSVFISCDIITIILLITTMYWTRFKRSEKKKKVFFIFFFTSTVFIPTVYGYLYRRAIAIRRDYHSFSLRFQSTCNTNGFTRTYREVLHLYNNIRSWKININISFCARRITPHGSTRCLYDIFKSIST